MKRRSIAILGTRGVPPRYGGFETFAAELGVRLIARGHSVSVYCRELGGSESVEDRSDEWNGIRRIVLPAVSHKYFETVSHSALSALDAIRREFDVVLVCNAANAFVLPLLRAARIPVAINVDGIERKRRKWNVAGKAVYAIGESFSVVFANAVVADAAVIGDYYRERFGIATTMIPYGADFPSEDDSDVLARLGLTPRGYLLYVSRFEPENNPLEVVQAYQRLRAEGRGPRAEGTAGTDRSGSRSSEGFAVPSALGPRPSALPLVMLGSGLYSPQLVAELERHRSETVLFPGALYGLDYRTLQRNALAYIQATEVGGTHPALIEAMGSGGCVLVHDTPENREVGGDAVEYFRLRPEQTLSGTLCELLSDGERQEQLRLLARDRVRRLYSWEAVTDRYEELFLQLAP